MNKLRQEDVWGKYDEATYKMIHRGMVVARSDETCPVWGDTPGYKSVTVICTKKQEQDVRYWLEFVHGNDCVLMAKTLADGRVAIRSDYMCW